MPTQVPIGSMRLSFVCTAIFAGCQGRGRPTDFKQPSSISGTSSSKSFMMNCGAVRERMSCGPRAWRSIFATRRAPVAHAQVFLRDHVLARQQRFQAARFDDRVAALHALYGAVTSSSPRDRKSCRICSRSASRMRCG